MRDVSEGLMAFSVIFCKVLIFGKGLNVRDWLYVENYCKAIDLIIHYGRFGKVYNIGGHNEMRNIDIVKLIVQSLGKRKS